MVAELLVIVSGFSLGDPRQYVMATVEELLSRLVNLENEAVQARQRQASAEQGAGAAAQQRIAQLSSLTDVSTTPPGVIDTRTLGKPKSFSGQTSEWTTWQFTFKVFACAVRPKMKEVFDADPVNASDITGEKQSLSTQLYYMLVMMLSDQTREIVRNSPEGIGGRSVAQVTLGLRTWSGYQMRSNVAISAEETVW